MNSTTEYFPCKAKDLLPAYWGRTKIKMAEAMMAGLMPLPKQLNVKFVRLHLEMIGMELKTFLEDQTEYICVSVENLFKAS